VSLPMELDGAPNQTNKKQGPFGAVPLFGLEYCPPLMVIQNCQKISQNSP